MNVEQIRERYFVRKINGRPIYLKRFPQKEVHEWHTIDKDSGRLANGVMERQIVGHKNKFIISFPTMYLDDFNTVLQMFSNDNVTLEYQHFFSGNVVEGNFYRADLTKENILIDLDNNNKTIVEVFTVTLIEL